ncbi:glycosyltransferase family 2 protein [Candidatus Peregrinibacteria bacterium CG10_big_fil_rev_8_21_14_0_10_49_10]|nr:MAG: glycosyltransferase family 2 protein [Candidatus Peregrinibacteria bacterium CG10_big_fil_rev_8_21_14_0_10_49_10]
MLSLIIPVFNEEGAVRQCIADAQKALAQCGTDFEIIVVNDGSTDGTSLILDQLTLEHVSVVKHSTNRGNGAAIKTGIRHAHGDTIATVDADGTYPIADIPKLFKIMQESGADMVVAARRMGSENTTICNRIGKLILTRLAIHLTQMHIPDINSGLRLINRSLVEKFAHLFPDGFSTHITITLAALTNGYRVEYVATDYYERIGKSKLSTNMYGPLNFFRFLCIVGRIVLYFRPMRFFVAPSVLLCCAAIVTFIYGIVVQNDIAQMSLVLLVAGLQLACFGLLADMISRDSQKK